MGIQKWRNGFRARLTRTFNGPLRDSEVAPAKDEKQYAEAAAESVEKLETVHEALQNEAMQNEPLRRPMVHVQKHKSAWRARIKKDG